jgi:hypothetical protein
MGSYVNLDHYPNKMDDILKSSHKFVTHLVAANEGYYPALDRFGDLGVRESKDPASDWLKTAQRLRQYKTFSSSYFLRVGTPTTQGGSELKFGEDGRLAVVDQQSVRLRVSFFSGIYDQEEPLTLKCGTDGTFLRVSSDDVHNIALRYDTVEFWLHPSGLNFDTLSRVTVALTSKSPESSLVPAYCRLPVVIRRSTSRMLTRIAASSTGALLIALPAILGLGSPLELRISSAVLGAALLAVSTIALGTPK